MKFFKNFYQTLILRYADRVSMEDHTVVDTRFGWKSKNLSIYFDITNIFNVEYRETSFVILPGRWIKAGTIYKFNLGK